MFRPATLRSVGSLLGYIGVALMLLWIARSIMLGGEGWPNGGLVETLERVPPIMWLFVPLAGLPGFLIHIGGDAIEAREQGLTIREVQFRRHLKIQPHLAKPKEKP